MYSTVLQAQTPSCRIKYFAQIETTTTRSLLKYIDTQTFNECCKSGCSNYEKKWSCPPYAPEYSDYIRNYRLIKVLMLKVELSQFSYIKNDYLKVKAANSILKSRVDKTLRFFRSSDVHYISTGSCRLCKPCKKKINEPCAHPKMMAYSFEALGVNVSLLVQDLFKTNLLWYSKSNLPQYTSVVAGLLYNNNFSEEKLIGKLMELH